MPFEGHGNHAGSGSRFLIDRSHYDGKTEQSRGHATQRFSFIVDVDRFDCQTYLKDSRDKLDISCVLDSRKMWYQVRSAQGLPDDITAEPVMLCDDRYLWGHEEDCGSFVGRPSDEKKGRLQHVLVVRAIRSQSDPSDEDEPVIFTPNPTEGGGGGGGSSGVTGDIPGGFGPTGPHTSAGGSSGPHTYVPLDPSNFSTVPQDVPTDKAAPRVAMWQLDRYGNGEDERVGNVYSGPRTLAQTTRAFEHVKPPAPGLYGKLSHVLLLTDDDVHGNTVDGDQFTLLNIRSYAHFHWDEDYDGPIYFTKTPAGIEPAGTTIKGEMVLDPTIKNLAPTLGYEAGKWRPQFKMPYCTVTTLPTTMLSFSPDVVQINGGYLDFTSPTITDHIIFSDTTVVNGGTDYFRYSTGLANSQADMFFLIPNDTGRDFLWQVHDTADVDSRSTIMSLSSSGVLDIADSLQISSTEIIDAAGNVKSQNGITTTFKAYDNDGIT